MLNKVEAIISPFKVDHVREALAEIGIDGMTISEVRGYGRHKGQIEIEHGLESIVEFVPKAKLELILPPALLNPAIQAILNAARTGEVGDGIVLVSAITDAIRIASGKRGTAAL